MRITACGHATLLAETADQRILIDPVFSHTLMDGALAFHPRRAIRPDRMPQPTVLVITHRHFDHWHPDSLDWLPRNLVVVTTEDEQLVGIFTPMDVLKAINEAKLTSPELDDTPRGG